jgi:hypothetical protein
MAKAIGPQFGLEQNSDGSRGGKTSPPAKSKKAAKNSSAGKGGKKIASE